MSTFLSSDCLFRVNERHDALHIANHLASLSSISLHIESMTKARAFYRQPVVEGILLLCVLFQIASGAPLVH